MTPFALDHPLVRDYLRRLDAATTTLPADEREEVREGIRSHLLAALAEAHSEADVRNALDSLGPPEEIVGAPQPPPPTASRRGVMEVAAVVLLLVGGLVVPVLGWFVGVALLWASKAWTVPQKLLGTLVVPGGLATTALAGLLMAFFAAPACEGAVATPGAPADATVTSCTGGPGGELVAILVVLVAAPLAVAVYLLRAAGRPRQA